VVDTCVLGFAPLYPTYGDSIELWNKTTEGGKTMSIEELLPERKESRLRGEDAARKWLADLDAHWNARDVKSFTDLFQEQGDIRWTNGQMLRGRAEIEATYTDSFAKWPKTHRHISTLQQIRFIREDVTIVEAEAEIHDLAELDAQEQVKLRLLGTIVLVREEKHWLAAALRIVRPEQQ